MHDAREALHAEWVATLNLILLATCARVGIFPDSDEGWDLRETMRLACLYRLQDDPSTPLDADDVALIALTCSMELGLERVH